VEKNTSTKRGTEERKETESNWGATERGLTNYSGKVNPRKGKVRQGDRVVHRSKFSKARQDKGSREKKGMAAVNPLFGHKSLGWKPKLKGSRLHAKSMKQKTT